MIPQIYNLLETKIMMIERNKISYLSRVHAVTKRKKKKKKRTAMECKEGKNQALKF